MKKSKKTLEQVMTEQYDLLCRSIARYGKSNLLEEMNFIRPDNNGLNMLNPYSLKVFANRILTFTKQASSMMRKRLRKELGKEISSKLKVSTFHSMAYAYMAKRGFLDGRRQVVSDDFGRVAKAIARNKNCELTPSELCDEVIKVGRMASYNAKKNESYKWFTAFYDKLDAAHLWDFDFLLFQKKLKEIKKRL